jgi:hypothetical protein
VDGWDRDARLPWLVLEREVGAGSPISAVTEVVPAAGGRGLSPPPSYAYLK